ncbi:MAG: TVP38/TMEM64 family protein, partial [Reyranella sp.]
MNTSTLRRLLPVAILLAGLATFLLLGLDRYFSFEMLARHKATVTAWVAAHRLPAALAFLLAYAIMVAFSLPVAMVATPVGGFLFGTWAGAGLSVIGATLG